MNRISKGVAVVAATGGLVLASAGLASAETTEAAPEPQNCLATTLQGAVADPGATLMGTLTDPAAAISATASCLSSTLGL